ncbi:MAG: porin family protein [Hyphomicrobiales bacterium]|nr:MAG: porin family protein [Hyphomicrobiales bacterium]
MKHITTILLAAMATAGLMSSAYAADLIIEEPAEVGVVDVSGNWDGAYVGAFIGAGWGLADHIADVGPCAPDGCDVDLSGWLVGVTAGANFTVSDNFVLGIAGDIAWTDIQGDDDSNVGPISNGVDWEGSLRAVAGFDGGAFMPYLTAGLAFAHAWHESNVGDGEGDATHFGLTAGVGVQIAVADNLSLDLQYRHSWYNEQEYDMSFAPFNPVFGLQTDRVTAGLNFRF